MDTRGYRLFIYDDIDKKNKEEDTDDVSLWSEYWKQIKNEKDWISITDQIYKELYENGWLGDLFFMDKKLEETNFKMKVLKLKESHKIGLIRYSEDVVKYFNDFDIEIKTKLNKDYTFLMYIDYNSGSIIITKYKN